MAPITTASNDETHAALLDQLDMQKLPRPFRSPNWKPPQRRNKNLKQILSEAQRAQQSIMNTQQNSGATTPQPATDSDTITVSLNPNPAQGSQDLSRLVLDKNARQANGGGLAVPSNLATGPSVTYTSIQAPPSLKPKTKYCDITGLPSKYIDPKTGLQYYNAEIYQIIKGLNTAQVQELPDEDGESITVSSQGLAGQVAPLAESDGDSQAPRVGRAPQQFKKRKKDEDPLDDISSDAFSSPAESEYSTSSEADVKDRIKGKRMKPVKKEASRDVTSAPAVSGRKRSRKASDEEDEDLVKEATRPDQDATTETSQDAQYRDRQEAALKLLRLPIEETRDEAETRQIMAARERARVEGRALTNQEEDAIRSSARDE